MVLWTIQPVEVFEELMESGIYCCVPEKSENCADFHNAYDWMEEKMISIIGPKPAGIKRPIWAWYCWDGKRIKPDMKLDEFRESDNVVVMEIDIPDDQVLLTDYNCWHAVLNNSYYHYEKTNEEWEKENKRYGSLPINEQERVKLQSWDKDVIVAAATCQPMVYIQATFWELKRNQVKHIWFYPANS